MFRLGSFELDVPIGKGGMGLVYAARASGLKRELAVKVLIEQRGRDSAFVAAFRNEVRAAASLDHPNVVAVYDYGEAEVCDEIASDGAIPAGTPYLVMERVSGSTLVPLCGKMGWGSIQGVVEQLLAALGHAHSRGVIHRDLKPANVLVGGHGDALQVKLTDFGLAHTYEGSVDLLVGGGTPAYMAPEQFTGTWREFGPWTDLYGLGCLAWMIVVGNPPFGTTRSIDEKRRQHVREPPPPIGHTTPIPPGFEGWLRRLLEKDPKRRFRRAADAAASLRVVARSPLPVEGVAIAAASLPEANLIDLGPPELGEPTLVLMDTTDPVGYGPPSPDVAESAVIPEDWRSEEAQTDAEVAGMGLYGLRTLPLVGREAERDALWTALRRVARSQRAGAVLLSGPAGSGKSRLAQWLCERADQVGAASALRCSHGPVPGPGHGVGTMLATFLRCQNLSHTEVAARVESVYRGGHAQHSDEWLAIAELVAPRGERERGGVRFQSALERYIPIRRLLCRVATERPVVIWLDDVQWGSDALALAAYLLEVQENHPAPILLVLTATDEELSQRTEERVLVEALALRPEVERVEVGALASIHHARLVRNLLGLDDSLARRVEERTAGNPLFAVQLVGDWVTRGLLEPSVRGYRLKSGVVLELPADLHAVWGGRVARLLADRPMAEVSAIELAACLGSDVDVDEWHAVCLHRGAVPSPACVEALLDQRLVTAGPMGPKRTWSFAHAMLREALVEQARRSGRLPLHHRACAAVIATRPEVGRHERLAHHLLAAGVVQDALAPLIRAAQERIGTGDAVGGEALLAERDTRMAELGVPEGDERWGEGWLLREELFRRRGDPGAADAWLDRVERTAAQCNWRSLRGRVLVLRARGSRTRGHSKEAERLAREGEAFAREQNDLRSLGEARYELAAIATAIGDVDGALGWIQRAGEAFDAAQDRVGVAKTRMIHGLCLMQAGRHGEAARLLEASEAAFELAGNRTGMANALNTTGDLRRFTGDLAGAESAYRRSRGLFRAAGAWQWVYPELNLVQLLLGREEFAQAEGHLESLAAEFERMGARTTLTPIQLGLALCAAVEGRWLAWDDHLREARSLIQESGSADEDGARLAWQAGEKAHRLGESARAIDALILSRQLWRTLGRAEEAAEVERLIAEFGG